ncbi:MAG: flagellar basal body-associated protein FliL [Desulfovibrionaceae bacterium]
MAEEYEGAEGKKGRGLLKWIILLLLLAVLIGGGWFAYKKFFSSDAKQEEQAKEQVQENDQKGPAPAATQGIQVQLPDFLVNLADPLGRRYLKLGVSVEVKDAQASEAMKTNEAKIKDAILLLLSSKTYQELSTLESKIELKKEIVERLNQVLGGSKVLQVYFTDMVIQ